MLGRLDSPGKRQNPGGHPAGEIRENKRMGRRTFWGLCLLACLAVTSLGEVSAQIVARSKCPKDAFYYRRHCYHPVYQPVTWDEAEIECQFIRSGSHLACIQNAAEEKLISSLIRRNTKGTDAWIGLHAEQEGEKIIWECSDGTPYTSGSRLWDNRTPRTATYSGECISITNIQKPGNAVRWIQRTCDTALPFVCKYKPSSV